MASTKIEKSVSPVPSAESVSTEKPETSALSAEAFVAQVTTMIREASTDATTGLAIIDQDKVNSLFRSVAQGDRSEARKALGNVRTQRLMAWNGDEADVIFLKALVAVEDHLSAKAPKVTPAPTDPRPGMIEAMVTLQKALATLREQVGTITPDERSSVTVTDEAVAAVTKAALPKATRTYVGPRRSVADHIAEAFADRPVGTFLTVTELSHAVTSVYPSGDASPGAIKARLDGSPIDGIVPTPAHEVDGKKVPFGATKTA